MCGSVTRSSQVLPLLQGDAMARALNPAYSQPSAACSGPNDVYPALRGSRWPLTFIPSSPHLLRRST